jgi:hypothetical protein
MPTNHLLKQASKKCLGTCESGKNYSWRRACETPQILTRVNWRAGCGVHPAQGVGWLLLLNIPKPNENLAWPAAQLHRDLFEVLFGSFLHLGNIGE